MSARNRNHTLTEASQVIATYAEALKCSHTIRDQWPDGEWRVKAEYDFLCRLVVELVSLKGEVTS